MLSHYKTTEEFEKATTREQILKNDKKIHHYLKEMESGQTQDVETLRQLHDGTLSRDDASLKHYLVKKLQTVRGATGSGL